VTQITDKQYKPEASFMTGPITQEINESRDIFLPFEWFFDLGFDSLSYAQLTLTGDRIAIHKPTDPNIEYKSPRKAGPGSYIRRISLFSVRLPKQLLEPLGIKGGDKIDLSLEENCIAIRKHIDNNEPELAEPKPPEPELAFCCVCGSLLYTENGLVKISSKYICCDCIEAVKSL
jgi:hypothetical protein